MPNFEQSSLSDFLASVAAKTPAPGGGAVACTTGALAASLAQMVVAYSEGRKSLAEHQPLLESARARLERSRALFLELAEEDARAYERLNELSRKAATDHAAKDAIPAAALDAARPPLACLAAAVGLLRLCEELCGRTNPHLRSDLAIAAVLAEACAASAAWNVRINMPSLPAAERTPIAAQCDTLVADAAALRKKIESACAA